MARPRHTGRERRHGAGECRAYRPAKAGVAMTADTGTILAVERTRLAYDRTLMAWLRTAVSLISFGFTIYKFFQFEIDKKVAAGRVIGPTEFALGMILTGLVALMLALVEYRQSTAALRKQYGAQVIPRSMPVVISAMVSVLGFAAVLIVLFGL